MARGRSTPYPAQLERFLAGLNRDRRTFSAAALEKEFTHPQHQKLGTTIGGIHKALMRAFADGKIISFVDSDGSVLRESEVVVPGSKAISRPQIFATEGTPSPEDDYRSVTYEELIHHEVVDAKDEEVADSEGEEADVADSADRPDADDLAPADGDHDVAERTPVLGLELSPEEAGAIYQQYLREMPENAPEWVPVSVLRVWATTPLVITRLRQMVRSGPMNERLALIRAGLARRLRSRRRSSARKHATCSGRIGRASKVGSSVPGPGAFHRRRGHLCLAAGERSSARRLDQGEFRSPASGYFRRDDVERRFLACGAAFTTDSSGTAGAPLRSNPAPAIG